MATSHELVALCGNGFFCETASEPVVVTPGVGMWVTPQGLSKLCESRAACPPRFARRCGYLVCEHHLLFVSMAVSRVLAGLYRNRRSATARLFLLDLQVQKIAEQDWLLAILASTAETYNSAEMVALGAAFVAEVADIAGCAFVNGVRDERGSLAESFPKKLFLQVGQRGVAETEGALAAGIRAKAAAAAAAWVRA